MADLIPEPHAGYARQVCNLIEHHGRSLRDQVVDEAGLAMPYVARLIEDPSIVCIAGERGSGKTTVLATAAAELVAKGHLVIPPLRPEYFPPSSSLIPMAVAHLKTTVASDLFEGYFGFDSDSTLKLSASVDRTLRQANLFSYGEPQSSSLRVDEQAADRSLAASADSNFIDTWQQLITEVRAMAKKRGKRRPLIVLPVDDPDLTPGRLAQILLDMRLLTSVDGVVGITCLDLLEVESVLDDAYTSSYKSAPNRLLAARVVQAQIAKAFPDDRQVIIEGLDGEQRLSFRALDLPLPSIETLCARHSMPEPYEGDTLAGPLRLPDSSPSLYTNGLPSNPRDLRGLAYRLSCIDPESPSGAAEAAIELCSSAIKTSLKQSGAIDPALWPSGLPFEVLPSIDGAANCVLRFDDISLRVVGRREHPLSAGKNEAEDDSTFIRIGHYSGVETQLVKRGEKVEKVRQLDPSFSYALLLIREFSDYYKTIRCSISGPIPYVGGDRRSQYLRVVIDNTETDNRFLNAPAWEAFYDYFVLDLALGDLVTAASTQHRLRDQRLVVEAYFLDFCHNIVSIQRRRVTAKNPARMSQAVRGCNDEEARELIERDLTKLFREIDDCMKVQRSRKRDDDTRASDFYLWVEVNLVNACHDRLLRPEFIDRLLELRANRLKRWNRLSAANRNAVEMLERRIKSALDEAWVRPLIDLTQRFDEDLANMLHGSHLAALDAIERGRQRLLGGAAIREVDEDEQPSQTQAQADDFEIAIAVLDELEAEAREAARQSPD